MERTWSRASTGAVDYTALATGLAATESSSSLQDGIARRAERCTPTHVRNNGGAIAARDLLRDGTGEPQQDSDLLALSGCKPGAGAIRRLLHRFTLRTYPGNEAEPARCHP